MLVFTYRIFKEILDYPSHNVAYLEDRHRNKYPKIYVISQNPKWPPVAILDFGSIIAYEPFVIESIMMHFL